MYRKNCNKCHKPSYSSSESGDWLCPICGTDLTDEIFLNAMTLEPVHTAFNKSKTPHTYSIKQISKNYRKRIGLSYYSKRSSTINNNLL
ncbi:hypothetical protein LIT38_05390 [Bacillus sp. CMF12]|uniref:hypothetical protein n=1 Tax=Bacillaceae TaxID=186817 RepID=UPI001FB32B12|nr:MULTISPECIES: hypothetical protein [Bacillaceae]UOE56410.1 hypothetical protein IRB79_06560 [Cytobacillus oceanisediminis]USK50898.1 hypothetical protein LIT38_05390 [Bacillus sp. CMF12]